MRLSKKYWKLYYLSLIIVLILTSSLLAQNSECWVEPIDMQQTYFLGDTVRFRIRVNTHNDSLTGYNFFFTINPDCLLPIINEEGEPFIPGDFIEDNPFPDENHTHGDEWGQSDMLNGIPGFQLDYVHQTGPSIDGVRPFVIGSGIAAYFDLVLIAPPEDMSGIFHVYYDHDNYNSRQTKYYLLGSNSSQPFSPAHGYQFNILAGVISPEIPDTLILPGTTLEINLNDHLFTQNLVDSLAIWDYWINALPTYGQTDIYITEENIFHFAGAENTHGIAELEIRLLFEGFENIEIDSFQITINSPPVFVDIQPDIESNEDVPVALQFDSLFTDANEHDSFTIWQEPESSYLDITITDSTIVFSPSHDWFGTENIYLFIQDELGLTINDTLTVNIHSINDSPDLDFSSISPMIMYLDSTDQVFLNNFVSDVDSYDFIFQVLEFNSAVFENIEIIANDILEIEPSYGVEYGLYDIIIEVADDSLAVNSDTLQIDIRSHPPVIVSNISDVTILADTSHTIELNPFVDDLDTYDEDLNWVFTAHNQETGTIDYGIILDYDNSAQTLTISANGIFTALDYVHYEVFDEMNSAEGQFNLYVFESEEPIIFPFPERTVEQNHVTEILDLDDYILNFNPFTVNEWSVLSGYQVQDLTISLENVVSVTTDGEFWGYDTLQFQVTNSEGFSTIGDLVLLVTPEDLSPTIAEMNDTTYYRNSSHIYGDLDDYISDLFHPNYEIIISIENLPEIENQGYIAVNLTAGNVLEIDALESGTQSITISAAHVDGSAFADFEIEVIQDDPPAWQYFPEVYLTKKDSVVNLNVIGMVTDDITEFLEMTLDIEWVGHPSIAVDYSPISYLATITLTDTTFLGNTWFRFSAIDEYENIGYSNTIDINAIPTAAPIWADLPVIPFQNDTIYNELFLYDYITDHDSEFEDLVFSVTNNWDNLIVEIVESTSQVLMSVTNQFTLFGEDLWITFHVYDESSNNSSTDLNFSINDYSPPNANLTYFFNPIAIRRLDFILTADGTVNSLNWNLNSEGPTGLTFSEIIHDLTDEQVWIADYKLTQSGELNLSVNLEDFNNNDTTYSLSLNTVLPRNSGGCFNSPDGQIMLQYPEYSYSNSQVLLLEEKNKSGVLLRQIGEMDQFNGNIYKLTSAGFDNGFGLRVYSMMQGLDDLYYSFFKVLDEELIQLDTYINEEGRFETVIQSDTQFVFGRSDEPAITRPIGIGLVSCYPNPFNPEITIEFVISHSTETKISIYNIMGQEVFGYSEKYNPGIKHLIWNGRDKIGNEITSGIYFVKITNDLQNPITEKITYLR